MMSFFTRSKTRSATAQETIEPGPVVEAVVVESPAAEAPAAHVEPEPVAAPARAQWSPAARWFFNDIFYIAMLLLALAGVILRLPVDYWIIITPIFALISIIEGWSHFRTRNDKLGLAFRIALNWAAVLLSIYVFDNNSVQGVMTVNAKDLAIITLLALGTFIAGVQAHVWQISAVGALLFLSVPGVGWLDNSPLILAAATAVIIVVGGAVWWIEEGRSNLADG
jgi:hypothetical protein